MHLRPEVPVGMNCKQKHLKNVALIVYSKVQVGVRRIEYSKGVTPQLPCLILVESTDEGCHVSLRYLSSECFDNDQGGFLGQIKT